MTAKKSRPPIIIGATDADRLTMLATRMELSNPTLADLLLGELERASIRPDEKVPATTVAMNSVVEFLDEAHGETRSVQLVYPSEADISANRVSVMTPVGAGLLGLSPGQSIAWPDRSGRERQLRILKVERPAA
ncbi:nucleoside diphosphate kinase regulator [Caulobacter sp. SLTY]|uniref:nucleoside diphosphate kinase regulator n=1 Tax=Caulobacter sp. SLTY TaxID=2683262 RepID=UPI001412D854|nr:nucleoside diphosphate kinase regulator [Caulobacter sp. SLTY]NBB17615.1 nucleoside diphosphate kinase regulator [Caulobacter sp. SLTY]